MHTLAKWLYITRLILALWLRNQVCYRRYHEAIGRLDEFENLAGHLMSTFMDGSSGSIALGRHIQPKPGYAVDENGERTSDICWEAPICYLIYLEQRPAFGISLEFKNTTIIVQQLQGVHGTVIPLELKAWPRIFIQALKTYVGSCDEFDEIHIRPAHARAGYHHPDGVDSVDLPDHQNRLRLRYNVTAKKEGFINRDHFWTWSPNN